MRQSFLVGMGVAAVVAAGLAADVARAGDEHEKDVRRPRHQAEVVRMFGGGGGRLGVSLEDVDTQDVGRLGLSAERGAVVADVQEGSAAEKAGVKEGDVILRFGGQDVWSAAQLARLVRETPAGRTVDLEVSRGGSIQKLAVALAKPDGDRRIGLGEMGEDFNIEIPELPELADLPAPPIPPIPPSWEGGEGGPMRQVFRFNGSHGRKLGLSFQEMGDQLARYFKVEGGVLVTAVEESGPAARAGVKAGDVIVRLDGKAVNNGGDLREALRGAAAGSNATIGVRRDGRAMDLTVKVGEAEPAQLAPAARARRRGART